MRGQRQNNPEKDRLTAKPFCHWWDSDPQPQDYQTDALANLVTYPTNQAQFIQYKADRERLLKTHIYRYLCI